MDSSRLALEVSLLSQASDGAFARSGDIVYFTETIRVGRNAFTFRITFPPRYPVWHPRVYLLAPALPSSLAIHRFTDGSLCLWGTAEWHPLLTGVWVRGRAVAWIAALLAFADTGVFHDV